MFDSATCTAVGARWDAWLVAARQSPGAFGELPDLPGPDLAGALDQWDPQSRADDELIDRIGSWEKLRAWVDAGQLADIVELTARRRHADELERADHAARGGQGEPGHLVEGPGPGSSAQAPAASTKMLASRPRCRCWARHRVRPPGDRDPENGMSHLWALLPADGAAAIMATLHRLAAASNTPADRAAGDHRTADQRRADALVDLATSYLDTHPALHTPTETDHQSFQDGDTARAPKKPRRRNRRPPGWAQVQVVLPANLLRHRG